jgi:hypothetical protein
VRRSIFQFYACDDDAFLRTAPLSCGAAFPVE